jgi:acetyl-CoA carboxylase biotin carboxyl carrier protein
VLQLVVSDFPISPEEVTRLAKLVEKHQLHELRVEDGELRVTLRTTVPTVATIAAAVIPSSAQATPTGTVASASPAAAAPVAASGTPVGAPIMGIFYRAPSPGAANFIEVGDVVEVGQPIGTIEAMKVFSEIPSDAAGKVIAIPMENGKLVQPGDVLIIIEAA